MNKENGNDYEWDDKYCYPNSFVLKNKFNITDKNEFSLAEREYTSLSIAEVKQNPIKGDFNLKHLQKYIFKDIYSWAGEIRTVNISKGNPFCNHMYINEEANKIFSELKRNNYLIGSSMEKASEKLAYFLGEINALHPFREGNGRCQRIMIEYLAQAAGYHVDFSNVSKDEMIKASEKALICDFTEMEKIFQRITSRISEKEQITFIKRISAVNSPVLKVYKSVKKNLILKNEDELEI